MVNTEYKSKIVSCGHYGHYHQNMKFIRSMGAEIASHAGVCRSFCVNPEKPVDDGTLDLPGKS